MDGCICGQEYNWGIVQWGIDNHTTLLTRPRAPPVLPPGETPMPTPTTPTKAKKLGGKNPSPKTGAVGARKRVVGVEVESKVQGGGEMEMEVVKEEKETEKKGMEEGKEVEMADVVGAMGGLKLVPVSVRFGRRGAGR